MRPWHFGASFGAVTWGDVNRSRRESSDHLNACDRTKECRRRVAAKTGSDFSLADTTKQGPDLRGKQSRPLYYTRRRRICEANAPAAARPMPSTITGTTPDVDLCVCVLTRGLIVGRAAVGENPGRSERSAHPAAAGLESIRASYRGVSGRQVCRRQLSWCWRCAGFQKSDEFVICQHLEPELDSLGPNGLIAGNHGPGGTE